MAVSRWSRQQSGRAGRHQADGGPGNRAWLQSRVPLVILILIVKILAAGPAVGDYLAVVNGLGETLSEVNLADSTVQNNIAVLGLVPNYVTCRYGKAFVVNSQSADLTVVNLKTGQVEETVDLGMGKNPWAVAFSDDTTLLITNFAANSITRLNLNDYTLTGEHPIGQAPQSLSVVGQRTYVTLSGFVPTDTSYAQGEVAVWDNAGDSLVTSIPVGTNPTDLDLAPNGRLYVICTGNYVDKFGIVYVVDTVSLTAVDSFSTGAFTSPNDLLVTAQGTGFLAAGGWVGQGEVFTFDVAGDSLLHGPANPLHTDPGVIALARATDSSVFTLNFMADNVTEVSRSGIVLARFSVGDGPVAAEMSPVCPFFAGDPNRDGRVNVADATFIINFVFVPGARRPMPVTEAGDANCDEKVNVADAVYLINYVFVPNSPPPCGCTKF